MHLSRQQLTAIFEHCAASQNEVCGILLGQRAPRAEIGHVIPGRNVHPSPARHFLLDAASLIEAHRLSERSGSTIIGFYHSHPNGSALPSLRDRHDAWLDMLMVIVAIADGAPRCLTGWQLDDSRRLLPIPIFPA